MALDELVDGVAQGLRQFLPEGFQVRSSKWGVVVRTATSRDVLPFALEVATAMRDGASQEEAVLLAANHLLSRLQDVASVQVGEPWPRDLTAGPSAFGAPSAVISDGALQMWFEEATGRRMTPVLSVVLTTPTEAELRDVLSRGTPPASLWTDP